MKRYSSIILLFIFIIMSTLVSYGNDTIEDTDGIEIISPTSDVLYSDYLLISVKAKDEKTFKFTLYASDAIDDASDIDVYPVASSSAIATSIESTEEDAIEDYAIFYGPVKVPTSGSFSFYTVQLEKLVPGKYQIRIEELNKDDEVVRTIFKNFEIKDKSEMPEEEVDPDLFLEKEDKTDVLQNIIKSIFSD